MSHIYEERLENDLTQIRTRVAELAASVEEAVQHAVQAVLRLDRPLANTLILGDLPINRASRALDRQCHYFIARHLPSAGHLRYISSVLRVNIALERIGDYAVTLAREAKTLSQPLDADVRRDLELLADEALAMLHQALQAFDERNADLARGTMGYAYQVDHTFSGTFDLLIRKGEEQTRPLIDLFAALIIFNRLERVSDLAKNICEETIFAVTGETKPPKKYRILFLEEADDCRSQLAVAMARKAFPESGTYTSAGLQPAEAVNPACVRFMEAHGLALSDARPRRFDSIPEDWKANHVVVSLQGPVDRYLGDVPFHTVALQWDVPEPPADGGTPEGQAAYEALYRDLSARITDLIETLHGEEAS